MIKGLKLKYKEIVGQSLRKSHLPQWDEQHFLEFFSLIHHFCPKGEWMWNSLAVTTFCQQAENRPLWEEWMWRYKINSEEKKPINIGKAIMGYLPSLGIYLQSSPHVITPRMREVMKGNPKLEKYTEPFKIIENEIGASIVVPNSDEGQSLALPEIQYHKAILKLAALANDLTAGVTKADLAKMPPDERIKLALSIVKLMSQVQGGQKPNIAVFKQLVVNNAGRDELEKAMLAYNQE